MPEFDKLGRRIVSVVRIIEYHGTDEWVKRTMEASRIPMQGRYVGDDPKHPWPEDHFINSGLVVWDIVSEEDGGIKTPIPIPPGSSRVQ